MEDTIEDLNTCLERLLFVWVNKLSIKFDLIPGLWERRTLTNHSCQLKQVFQRPTSTKVRSTLNSSMAAYLERRTASKCQVRWELNITPVGRHPNVRLGFLSKFCRRLLHSSFIRHRTHLKPKHIHSLFNDPLILRKNLQHSWQYFQNNMLPLFSVSPSFCKVKSIIWYPASIWLPIRVSDQKSILMQYSSCEFQALEAASFYETSWKLKSIYPWFMHRLTINNVSSDLTYALTMDSPLFHAYPTSLHSGRITWLHGRDAPDVFIWRWNGH